MDGVSDRNEMRIKLPRSDHIENCRSGSFSVRSTESDQSIRLREESRLAFTTDIVSSGADEFTRWAQPVPRLSLFGARLRPPASCFATDPSVIPSPARLVVFDQLITQVVGDPRFPSSDLNAEPSEGTDGASGFRPKGRSALAESRAMIRHLGLADPDFRLDHVLPGGGVV